MIGAITGFGLAQSEGADALKTLGYTFGAAFCTGASFYTPQVSAETKHKGLAKLPALVIVVSLSVAALYFFFFTK